MIKLKLITVDDARFYYNHCIPIVCKSFQTFGGKDENGKYPHIKNYDELDATLFLNGSLKEVVRTEKGSKHKIIKNWLSKTKEGPYFEGIRNDALYYLGIDSPIDEQSWVQICSGPMNCLSTDCLDECNYWQLKSVITK